MLSERQLDALLQRFEARMQAVNDEYIALMGEHLKAIGKLKPSDVHRLTEMKRIGINAREIRKKLAKAAKMDVRELDKVFRAVAESDARFMQQWFEADYAPEVKDGAKLSKPIERTLNAQLRITAQEFKNLSRTTIQTEAYQKAVDVAIQSVQAGVTDYSTAIRRAMKAAAAQGLRVKYPSGLTRRLDSAARQNILDGVRAVNNDILRQLGNEYGSDGVEISAHALCAEDHLPYQGRQFSNKEFERIQNSLKRPFGQWNCKHAIYPILLGVSVQANSEETLAQYRANSEAQITIDGKTKTRYEWSQEQRKTETAIRYQKDIANAAKASGDDVARREAQANINALKDRYEHISEAAGLSTDTSRASVAGFRSVKTVEQLKKTSKDAIIQVAGQNVNASMRGQKQQEHIIGTKMFDRRMTNAMTSGNNFPSAFLANVDVQKLVSENMGKGKVVQRKDGSLSEYFTANSVVGWTYSREMQAYIQTRRVCIRYSKNGWHAFPVEEES